LCGYLLRSGTYKALIVSRAQFSTSYQHPAMSTTQILSPAVLFDNVKPDEPHPALMHEYIRIFSRECTTELPFVNCESITAGYLSSTLSAPLANALAAIAVPYVFIALFESYASDAITRMAIAVPCLAGTDLRATSETYLTTAKVHRF
jgi:hypothetical protein